MYENLTQLDASNYNDHHYLAPSDRCFYYGEYTARKGFDHSKTNQLILNLKISVEHKNTPRYHHKNRAMEQMASCLAKQGDPGAITFVPVPPSKCKSDPCYDNRLVRILELFGTIRKGVDYRELVNQSTSTRASHESEDHRLTPDELEDLYVIDQSLLSNLRPTIVIFDDMLTTGSHFVAMRNVIQKAVPNAMIAGLFIARRVPDSEIFF
ncbi:hypothetical protein [Pseudoteredinibacter isoporae]|uniref:hypothetical protein n=1 Tax=Pseudoteredinibacter isoporae TaxID=570281 RepID=UPI0031050EB2